MSPAARWCPTREQLMILEEIYRSGMRTPNASQIQHITAHLSFYGKIEGKNVFYWFQNHKARDRQKLRRKLSKQIYRQHHHHDRQNHYYQHHSHRLLHYLDSPPPPPPPPPSSLPPPPPHHQQLSHLSSVGILPWGRVEEGGSKQTWSCTWRVNHLPERFEMDKSMPGTYGRDWMMMHDVGPAAPCFNKPFQTLELFPITATALKDQYCTPA